MKVSARTAFAFNIAAIVVAVSAVGGVIRSWVYTPTTKPCEQRYSNVLHFKLDRDGHPLAPTDLQARSGGRDAGLLTNVEITTTTGAPKPVIMKVSVPKGTSMPDPGTTSVGGMQFPWEPRNVQGQKAACLAYNVMLTHADAGDEAVLPGLKGADEAGEQHFAVHPASLRSGEAGTAVDIAMKTPPAEASAADPSSVPLVQSTRPRNRFEVETTNVSLPKGRWIRVNQEIVLNAPDASDGIMRFWLDGKLVFERTDARVRSDAGVGFTGVAATAHMLADGPKAVAGGDSSIALTPFELYW